MIKQPFIKKSDMPPPKLSIHENLVLRAECIALLKNIQKDSFDEHTYEITGMEIGRMEYDVNLLRSLQA